MPRLTVLCSVLLWAACAAAEPHRLGLSAPLSGPGAGWGNDVKNVLLFANEKLAGGRYSLVFEDDRCDPKTALSAARKFISIDHVREVFVVCGQSVLSSAKTYREAGTTVMASLATPSRISELGVFRTSLSDAAAADMLARYIAARHGSVAAITEDNEYSVSFFGDFARSSKALGLEASNETYIPEQQDFRAQLLRLKRKNVDAVFLNTQTEQALLTLVKQLKELKYSPKLYGAYLPGSAEFLKIGGASAEGLVFVDFPGAAELLSAQGRELYTEYLARFGPLHGWTFAFPATFEAFRAVHMAITSGEPVADYLRHTRFEGIFGSYSFDKRGDIVGPQQVLRVIHDGKSELVNDAPSNVPRARSKAR